MTIGQLAREAGVSRSAIRFYESAGILKRPERRNGVRRYDRAALAELQVLRFYRESGIPIRGLAEIAGHVHGSQGRRDAWAGVLKARIAALERQIEDARRARRMLKAAVACRCGGITRRCAVLRAAGVAGSG
jgi:MerR family transcriptional regulator, redox-sensitive transcriptional activator SoxR